MTNEMQQNAGMEERKMTTINGFLILFVAIALLAAAAASFFMIGGGAGIALCVVLFIVDCFVLGGFAVIRPNEAMVLTLFGKYSGTIKGEGFYWYNPFCSPVRYGKSSKISLKAMTLESGQQKINDELGNPVMIGIVVIWRVTNTAKAVFDVDDYEDYLATQSDAALRTTASTTTQKNRCKAPARKSLIVSKKRSSRRCTSPVSRSSKRALPIWPTRLRSPAPCCSVSRQQPSSTLAL